MGMNRKNFQDNFLQVQNLQVMSLNYWSSSSSSSSLPSPRLSGVLTMSEAGRQTNKTKVTRLTIRKARRLDCTQNCRDTCKWDRWDQRLPLSTRRSSQCGESGRRQADATPIHRRNKTRRRRGKVKHKASGRHRGNTKDATAGKVSSHHTSASSSKFPRQMQQTPTAVSMMRAE